MLRPRLTKPESIAQSSPLDADSGHGFLDFRSLVPPASRPAVVGCSIAALVFLGSGVGAGLAAGSDRLWIVVCGASTSTLAGWLAAHWLSQALDQMNEAAAATSLAESQVIQLQTDLAKVRDRLNQATGSPLGWLTIEQFQATINREWQRSIRAQQAIAIVACQIILPTHDSPNPSTHFGPSATLIPEILQRLDQAFERSIKRASDCIAQLAGDHWFALLPDTDALGAISVGEDLQREFEQLQNNETLEPDPKNPAQVSIANTQQEIEPDPQPAIQHTQQQPIRLAIGIATALPKPGESAQGLFSAAITVLDLAYRQGGDRVYLAGLDSTSQKNS